MWMIYKKYMKMKGFVWILALLNFAATVTHGTTTPCSKPDIPKGYFYPDKELYGTGDQIFYACETGYQTIKGQWWDTMECTPTGWSAIGYCAEVPCDVPPQVKDGVVIAGIKKYYTGDEVEYKCRNAFIIEGPSKVVCENGKWTTPPVCVLAIFRRCEPLKIDNGYRVPEKSTYDPNESVELGCYPPYELKGQRKITCENGHWTETPQCQRNGGTCGPPPTVEDGIIIKRNEGSKSVTYECQRYYVLEGDSTIRCHSGKWSDAPTCIGPCIINKEQLKEKKLRDPQTIYLEHGKSHKFVCKYGYYMKDTPYITQVVKMCARGQMDVPECVYY
ncbi:coagulation factor XIII B chain-like isoform X1 [Acipenser ruthenus]|uniref:coagulation factor XIII B chain-like isoform X1 n=1 Tax=Acipenser ruthenus TaxID=7906 RepID=UPI002741B1FC|nr:coagulation factor XIII B chain-like isoform X1 [Acipenser ruthenus]